MKKGHGQRLSLRFSYPSLRIAAADRIHTGSGARSGECCDMDRDYDLNRSLDLEIFLLTSTKYDVNAYL